MDVMQVLQIFWTIIERLELDGYVWIFALLWCIAALPFQSETILGNIYTIVNTCNVKAIIELHLYFYD